MLFVILPVMDRRDIIIGFVILIILAVIVYWVSRPKSEVVTAPTPTPVSVEEVEKKIEDQFQKNIPETGQKAGLKDLTGGDSSGLAVKEKEDNLVKVSILADLPDPEEGYYYQAWVVKDVEGKEEKVSLGKLTIAKGGFSLEYQTKADLDSFNKIVISLEKTVDDIEEKRVLEGSL